jgi:hypothetical protein
MAAPSLSVRDGGAIDIDAGGRARFGKLCMTEAIAIVASDVHDWGTRTAEIYILQTSSTRSRSTHSANCRFLTALTPPFCFCILNMSIEDLTQKEFDYVICGGGTAGLVVAALLTEDPHVTVAVIEAGGNGLDDFMIDAPNLFTKLYGQAQYDWDYKTVPQVSH